MYHRIEMNRQHFDLPQAATQEQQTEMTKNAARMRLTAKAISPKTNVLDHMPS